MLMETTNRAFQVGDTVIDNATKQAGTIKSYQNGKWVVEINNTTVLKESHEIQKRQILMG